MPVSARDVVVGARIVRINSQTFRPAFYLNHCLNLLNSDDPGRKYVLATQIFILSLS